MPTSKFSIDCSGWRFLVKEGRLSALKGSKVQLEIDLAPLVEGRQSVLTGWTQEADGLFRGALSEAGSVCLQVREGHLAYWMETDVKQFNSLTYFPGMTFSGRRWQTFMSDEHDRKWEVEIDQKVGISTAYDGFSPFGADGAGMTDPGDNPPYWIWNTPARAFAVETKADWFGFSIPGPLPSGILVLQMERGELSATFNAARPACAAGQAPRVYFIAGLADPYDLLDEHRAITDRLGFTIKKDYDHPAWWTNPEYNYYDEYLRLNRANSEKGLKEIVVTRERYLDWLNTTKQLTGMREMNITLEQGCYNYYGDYCPVDGLGGVEGARAMIDQLRKEGTHVGHYIHPYLINAKCDFWKEHPEAFCRPKDAAHKSWWALEDNVENPEFHFLDWTNPLARQFMENLMRYLYSDGPGCLNCDTVRSNNWISPDPRLYDFHDPDWGIGDLMSWKVQRFIYQTAKKIKPDCFVERVSIADPYMQPWADANYLCEEWNGYTDNWYKRGRIATRTMGDSILLTDPFIVTLTKGDEYHMGMMAWNYPHTTWVRHAIHPYMYYREAQEKHLKRRKAGFHTAMNAPLRVGDISRVNILPDGQVEQWRKRTKGKLAGFYAGLAIGKRTLATYSETEARIATSITRTIQFPLPPGAELEKVEMVPHEGAPEPWPYETVTTDDGPGLRMRVEDCGQRAFYYLVRYTFRS